MEKFLEIERYMVRLTKECDISEVEIEVKGLHPIKYIIGSELSKGGKRHFHIYLETQNKLEEIKKGIKDLGYSGNKEWSIKKCDSNSKVKSYVVKDGDYVYSKNIDSQLIEGWVKASSKKLDENYHKELNEIIEKYLRNEIKHSNLLGVKKIELQIKYGIYPSRNEHVKFLDYWNCKKDIGYCKQLHDNWTRLFN